MLESAMKQTAIADKAFSSLQDIFKQLTICIGSIHTASLFERTTSSVHARHAIAQTRRLMPRWSFVHKYPNYRPALEYLKLQTVKVSIFECKSWYSLF